MANARALRLLALAGALALLQASPIRAQEPQQPSQQPQQDQQGQGEGRGRGEGRRPDSPERAAEREAERKALQAACSADLEKFCAKQEGRGRFQCLREHRTELSASCGTELEKRRGRRRGQRPQQPQQPQSQP